MTTSNDSAAKQASTDQASTDRQAVDHMISTFKTVEGVRKLALPATVIAAGVSAVLAPIAFPITATVAAAALGMGEWFVRRGRKQLQKHLEDLKNASDVTDKDYKEITATANRLTVGGSSD